MQQLPPRTCPGDPGTQRPGSAAFDGCCIQPAVLSVAATADTRPNLICAPQLLAGQAFPCTPQGSLSGEGALIYTS